MLLFDDQPRVPTNLGLILNDGAVFRALEGVLPSTSMLLRQSLELYFGTPAALAATVLKGAKVLILPLLLAALATHLLRDASLLGLFMFLLLASAPLYFVAADWGRFVAYSFLLAMLVSARLEEGRSTFVWPAVDAPLSRAVAALQGWSLPCPLSYAAPLVYFSHDSFRQRGISSANLLLVLAYIAVIAVSKCRAPTHA